MLFYRGKTNIQKIASHSGRGYDDYFYVYEDGVKPLTARGLRSGALTVLCHRIFVKAVPELRSVRPGESVTVKVSVVKPRKKAATKRKKGA